MKTKTFNFLFISLLLIVVFCVQLTSSKMLKNKAELTQPSTETVKLTAQAKANIDIEYTKKVFKQFVEFFAKYPEFLKNLKKPEIYKEFIERINNRTILFTSQEENQKRSDSVVKFYDEDKTDAKVKFFAPDEVSKDDIESTKEIFEFIKQNKLAKFGKVLEFAAGLGRVTKGILLDNFKELVLVEPTQSSVDVLKQIQKQNKKIKEIHHTTVQNYKFDQKFDVIFCEGFFDYLNETDLFKLLLDIRRNLKDNGVVIIKENSPEVEKEFHENEIKQRVRSVFFLDFLFKATGFKAVFRRKQFDRFGYTIPGHEFVLVKEKKEKKDENALLNNN